MHKRFNAILITFIFGISGCATPSTKTYEAKVIPKYERIEVIWDVGQFLNIDMARILRESGTDSAKYAACKNGLIANIFSKNSYKAAPEKVLNAQREWAYHLTSSRYLLTIHNNRARFMPAFKSLVWLDSTISLYDTQTTKVLWETTHTQWSKAEQSYSEVIYILNELSRAGFLELKPEEIVDHTGQKPDNAREQLACEAYV